MTLESEEIDLPVFCRQVAVVHEAGGADEGEPPHTARRILQRFSGVLGVGVTVGDWPPPTLSYLTLDRLAAAALADSRGDRRAASKDIRSATDTDTGTDTAEEESEPRVRELIRDDSSSAGETSLRLDSPRMAAPGRLTAGESGILVDPPSVDQTGGPGDPFQGSLDRPPAGDQHGITLSSPIEGYSTGQTERGESTVRTEVVQPGEIRRRRANESSPGPGVNPPGTDEERATEQTVGRESERNSGDDGRSGDREFGPSRVASTVAGSRARQRSVPAMTILRAAPRVLTPRPDRPESSRSRPRDARDQMEGGATGFERSPRDDAPSLAGSDAGAADTGIRMEPLETPTRAPGPTVPGVAEPDPRTAGTGEGRVGPGDGEGPRMTVRRNEGPGGNRSGGRMDSADAAGSQIGWPPRGDAGRAVRGDPQPIAGTGVAEPGSTTARTGDGRVDPGDSRPPRMTVRRDEGSSSVTGGEDADGNRSGGRTDAADANGSPAGQSTRGNADRDGTSDPQRIDDLLDFDRLADRLMRAFERKARIERERRGR